MKKLYVYVMIMVITAVFVSCGGDSQEGKGEGMSSSNSSGTDSPTSKPTEAKSKDVKITIRQQKREIVDELLYLVDAFTQENPHVTIEILGTDDYNNNLQTTFSVNPNKVATIFAVSNGDILGYSDHMTDLSEHPATGTILPGLEKNVTVNGKVKALPMLTMGLGLVYNKDLLQSVGYTNPAQEIKSIKELENALSMVSTKTGVTQPFGLVGSNPYFLFNHFFNIPLAMVSDYRSTLNQLQSGVIAFEDIPEARDFVKALDILKPYTNTYLTYDQQIDMFAKGELAVIHQGAFIYPLLKDYVASGVLDFTYGMMPFPLNGNDKLAISTPYHWAVSTYASPEEQTAAKDFLAFLLTSDYGKDAYVNRLNLIPPYVGFDISNVDPLSTDVLTYGEQGKSIPWAWQLFPKTYSDFNAETERYYAGKISSDELLTRLGDVWERSIK